MDIQWLISTCGDRIKQVENVVMDPLFKVTYLISHQTTGSKIEVHPSLNRLDVNVVTTNSMGLSANRNNALKHATGSILVVGDDDIGLKPIYANRILKTFTDHPDVDVACFQILTSDTGQQYKNYPKKIKRLTSLKSLKNVSSIEIAFRRKSIEKAQICFDERFGLGKPANCGEEFIFLAKCLRKGLSICFFPMYVVEHPSTSSVNQRPVFEDIKLIVSGAQNYVLFGSFAYVLHVLALIRRLPALKREKVSAKRFLQLKNAGCTYIKTNVFELPQT
jgi:glycosyltransferase involved in cell wall biosynthesis